MKLQFNLQADKPTANGTIYPKDILKKAVDEYNKNYVENDRALGEIQQPKNLHTELSNIAFKINEIEQEDDHWNAEIEILKTPQGEILKDIIDKAEYRIVTMGVGEYDKNEDGTHTINKFEIVGVGIEPKENCA